MPVGLTSLWAMNHGCLSHPYFYRLRTYQAVEKPGVSAGVVIQQCPKRPCLPFQQEGICGWVQQSGVCKAFSVITHCYHSQLLSLSLCVCVCVCVFKLGRCMFHLVLEPECWPTWGPTNTFILLSRICRGDVHYLNDPVFCIFIFWSSNCRSFPPLCTPSPSSIHRLRQISKSRSLERQLSASSFGTT